MLLVVMCFVLQKSLVHAPVQWFSLFFCSEYTVIFSFPASYSPVPEQPFISTTRLTKQGSTLTFILGSTCAANKK